MLLERASEIPSNNSALCMLTCHIFNQYSQPFEKWRAIKLSAVKTSACKEDLLKNGPFLWKRLLHKPSVNSSTVLRSRSWHCSGRFFLAINIQRKITMGYNLTPERNKMSGTSWYMLVMDWFDHQKTITYGVTGGTNIVGVYWEEHQKQYHQFNNLLLAYNTV